MPYIIDIGGAPANEDCAQLGQTPDFANVNTFEVFAYKLAIIARYGTPPAGCRLGPHSNRHDFGTYRTLVLHVDDELNEAVQAYAEAVEEGLGSWVEACFSPPVTYEGAAATIPRTAHEDLVVGALMTSRPSADGSFAIPDFETIHTNLSAAFPEQAEAARIKLASG